MVRGGRDHCGTRIPSFYDGDDDGDDVDVDDVDKDYIGDLGAIHQHVSETVRILFQSTWLG